MRTFMTTSILLVLMVIGSISWAETQLRCGEGNFSFCVGETVYGNGYYDSVKSGYHQAVITRALPNNYYEIQWKIDGSRGSQFHQALWLIKTKGKNPTYQDVRINDIVIANGHYDSTVSGFKPAKVVGYDSNGNFLLYWETEQKLTTQVHQRSWFAKTKGCGTDSPRICVGYTVTANGHYDSRVSGIKGAKVIGVTTANTYVLRWDDGEISTQPHQATWLIGIQRGGNIGAELTCEGVDAYLSDSPSDVLQSYLALSRVSTAERSDFLVEVSKFLVAQNQGDSTLFARMVFAKVVSLSTAKVVKGSFAEAVKGDQAELQKIGWKSIEQIEAKVSTLDFASRILAAAVKLRLNMPDSNDSLASFRSRLAASIADTKLSTKITTLQQIVTDMQPLLIELVQDPRHSSLGMVSQDVAGWIMKN
jgi:hypothetical protein